MTTPNVNDLDDAAIEAMLEEEDRAHGAEEPEPQGDETEGDAEGEGATTEQAKDAGEGESTPAADEGKAAEAEDAAGKAVGVLGKDGKRVLPYGVLKGARREAAIERQRREQAESEAERLRKEIEDLKAGKTAADDPMSDQRLDELAQDYPQYAAAVAKLKEQRAAKPAPESTTEDEPGDDNVQEAIDSVPLLAEWQASNPELWKRAIEIDRAITGAPRWQGKPLEARFAHVAKLVAQEHDIAFEDEQPSQTTTPTPRPKPEDVVKAAPRKAPNTLSDFKGGAPTKTDSIDRLPASRQLDRMMAMSDEEIDAHLAKLG